MGTSISGAGAELPTTLPRVPTPGYEPSTTPSYAPYDFDPTAVEGADRARRQLIGAVIGVAAGALLIGGGLLLARKLKPGIGGGPLGTAAALRLLGLVGAVGGGLIGAASLCSTTPAARNPFEGNNPESGNEGVDPGRVTPPVGAPIDSTESVRSNETLWMPVVRPSANHDYVPTGGDLLPDVQPRAPKELFIRQQGSRRVLGFSFTSFNDGPGPLEVAFNSRTYGDVTQRILGRDGIRRDFHSNADFSWVGGDHSHTHLNDFARYELFELADRSQMVAGKQVAQTFKVSFLITDTDNVVGAEIDPNGLRRRVYDAVSGRVVQGMSTGYGDTYGAGLDGQQLDITNVTPGWYILRQTFDPNNRIAETDDTNNSYDTLIHIGDNGQLVTADTKAIGPARVLAPVGQNRSDGAQSW